ncbi:MAG: hypothetical protein IJY06_11145 [Oscillospiraceae bacterium]|jgi:uncharacterized membrane protein|nr:hypothetical protein [Oscillospiraceae bacterium]MBQ9111900.1 hypothetical protein [Oscillospiraceae bacterium]
MQKTAKLCIPFLIGFFLYAMIEITARGYTHWTMALTGGVILTLLYQLFTGAPERLPVPVQYLLGAVIITSAELLVGLLVNVRMQWDVWDYSDLPLNFRGQICLLYSTFWFFLCIPARIICLKLDRFLEQRCV